MLQTLKDVLPHEALGPEYEGAPFREYLDVRVIGIYGVGFAKSHVRWPGKQVYVYNWWLLENAKAVGWNENPSRGWSFPVVNVKAF
jgi:hypothetical protein